MIPGWLEEKLSRLPAAPGVYLMKDRAGEVIYVGKAINLRARVRSYFTGNDTRAFIPLLDRLLGDVETLVVSTEKEALLLENELIKQHQPRFNVLLKDDKNFICLRLDVSQDWPRLEVVRRFKNDGARYFGPYASATSIRETLRIINRYFQLRTCSDHALHNRRRPCLLHQIGRCPAPCVYEVPREDYHRHVQEAVLFLEGKATELSSRLKLRMQEASRALRFEEAARLRDQFIAIERSLERQKVADSDPVDRDVFALHREGDRLLLYVLYLREGRISGGQAFPFNGQEFPSEELLPSFVNLYYAQDTVVPEEVLLPQELEGADALEALLAEKRGGRVRVLVPRRGAKAELLELARRNAAQAFVDRQRTREESLALLDRLQRRLHLVRRPRRMECFDVSHFQGSAVVASQVAVTDGELDRARYRRFKVKTVAGNDDFASLYEIISRRARRGDLPDLLVIDGGKGQLASALAALKDAGAEGAADVVGLAKARDLEVTDDGATRSEERIFLPGRKDPIVLPQRSAELFLLTRMRDEAHRFAITYQQQLLRRRTLTSVLEDIPGVGEGRRTALLRHFGSARRVKEADIEALAEVVGPALAERVHAVLHGDAPAPAGRDEDEVRDASLEDAGPGAA